MNVNVPFENDEANWRRDWVAGPTSTLPLVENSDPWRGHRKREFEKPLIVSASCVQIAVNTENVSWVVWVMRNVPIEVEVIAAPPTFSRAVPAVVTETVRPLTDDATEDRPVPGVSDVVGGVEDMGGVGADGESPHPVINAPAAASEAAWQAWVQNSRRVLII